jgi:hypothetical protein
VGAVRVTSTGQRPADAAEQPPSPGGPAGTPSLSGQAGEQLPFGLPSRVSVGVDDADRDHQDFSLLSISIMRFERTADPAPPQAA